MPEHITSLRTLETHGLMNWETTFERIPGGEKEVVEVMEMFLVECPQQFQNLFHALEAEDSKSGKRAAHTIKGSASIFGANQLSETAHAVERAIFSGDWNMARLELRLLESRMNELLQFFQTVVHCELGE